MKRCDFLLKSCMRWLVVSIVSIYVSMGLSENRLPQNLMLDIDYSGFRVHGTDLLFQRWLRHLFNSDFFLRICTRNS